MNERIVDILQLKDDAADVVAHSLDFFKKFNLLKTVAIGQTPPDEKKRVEDIFSGIAKQNDSRTMVAHCRFEPAAKGSVQFRRTVARDGKVKIDDPLWTPEKFAEEFEKLDDLRAKLAGELKPTLTFKIGEDGTSVLLRRYMFDDEGPLSLTSSILYDPSFPTRIPPSQRGW